MEEKDDMLKTIILEVSEKVNIKEKIVEYERANAWKKNSAWILAYTRINIPYRIVINRAARSRIIKNFTGID